jgi:hypothetical protein
MADASKGRPKTRPVRAAERKPYSSPRLVEYGHLSKLTGGNTGAKADAPGLKK